MEPSLLVIGVNFGTAPVVLRERFSFSQGRRHEVLQSLVRSEGIEEAVVLRTSCRTELVVWASDAAEAANSVLRLLTRECDLKLCEWSSFHRLLDEDALMHVFRIAANADSETEGEANTAAEIDAGWKAAQQAGTSGPFLDAVIGKALIFAERVQERGPAADVIAREEAQGFRRQLLLEHAAPSVVALRTRLDEICRQELTSLGEQLGPFTEDQRQTLSKLAAHITQRIAGSLARELKEVPGEDAQEELAAVVERLFRSEMKMAGH